MWYWRSLTLVGTKTPNYIVYLVLLQKSSLIGSQFSLWAAGFARDGVGVLVCIALDGFHAVSQYQWAQNNRVMEDETYAVLYTSSYGEYKCRVTLEEQISMKEEYFQSLVSLHVHHCS